MPKLGPSGQIVFRGLLVGLLVVAAALLGGLRGIERAGNVVLGAALTEVNTSAYSKEDLNPPIDELLDRAAAFGYVNFLQDADAFIRSASVTRIFQDAALPGFDFHLHRLGSQSG